MVKKYVFAKTISDETMQNMEGRFLDECDFAHHVLEDSDGFMVEGDGTQRLLFKFRRGAVPEELCALAVRHLEAPAKIKNFNRGASAGLLEKDKMPKNVSEIVQTEKFRAKVKFNKEFSKYQIGNVAQSNIVGYFDDTKSKNIFPCRTTKFTRDNPEVWEECLPVVKHIDNLFRQFNHEKWLKQHTEAQKTNFIIRDTCFSTITLNYNFQTAIHKDKGDFRDGFGNLVVFRRGGWMGNNLCLPQYGVCIHIDHGDYLTFDVHQWHCNTKLIKSACSKSESGQTHTRDDDMRLSLVLYLRENIIKRCSNERDLYNRKKTVVPFFKRVLYSCETDIVELANYSKGYDKIKESSFLFSKIIFSAFCDCKGRVYYGPLQYMSLLEYFVSLEPECRKFGRYLKYREARNEDGRSNGREEDGRGEGREEDGRSKGREEDGRSKGREEDGRIKGREEDGRGEGREEDGRGEGVGQAGRKMVVKSMNSNYCLIELFRFVRMFKYKLDLVILTKKGFLVKICI
jgi:hypothetical protein